MVDVVSGIIELAKASPITLFPKVFIDITKHEITKKGTSCFYIDIYNNNAYPICIKEVKTNLDITWYEMLPFIDLDRDYDDHFIKTSAPQSLPLDINEKEKKDIVLFLKGTNKEVSFEAKPTNMREGNPIYILHIK